MPRNFPPKPAYAGRGARGEKRVWQALQELPDEAVVFAQYRMLDSKRITREADFIVAWPGVGLAVIEVKGGGVWSAGTEWFSRDHRGIDHAIRDPLRQAAIAGHALRDFAWGQGHDLPPWTPVVVLPDTDLTGAFHTAASRREQWIDRSGLPSLAGRLSAGVYDENAERFDEDAVEAIIDLLERRLPKPVEYRLAADGLDVADMITRDQYAILGAVRCNNRIIVSGGPGTGKTWLAMEHARSETARGARAALLVFNRALALHLRQVAQGWPVDQRPAFIGTLHQAVLSMTGGTVPDPVPAGFWDALPARLIAAAPDMESADRFDLVVVDEAQDFDAGWWPAVTALLGDPDDGPLVIFRDDSQTLYDRDTPEMAGVEVWLSENVRNTTAVARVLGALPGGSAHCRGREGPDPILVPVPDGGDEQVLRTADEVVATLLASGEWRPADIALLTTFRRHPGHVERLTRLGPEEYSASLVGSDIAISTVKSFKGLERPVVVVAVNGFHESESPVDLLRVGMSRPTHRLIVVADPAALTAVGGDALVGLLG